MPTDEALPAFRFYADPYGDQGIAPSDGTCDACERRRGWLSQALLYTEHPGELRFCPWCISDGRAVGRFGGTFNDLEDGPGDDERVRELIERTPNFVTWQDWAWPVHCAQPAIYQGQPSAVELAKDHQATTDLREQMLHDGIPAIDVEEILAGVGPDRSVTAYQFQCSGCSRQLARWDCD